MNMRIGWGRIAAGLCAALTGFTGPVAGADDGGEGTTAAAEAPSLPAVDGINGSVSAFGGLDQGSFYGGAGTLSLPLGTRFGLQVDGFASHLDDTYSLTVRGAAAHLFWRDPSVGLLGVYGQYARAEDVYSADLMAGAGEGALYIGRLSLEGMVGAQGGDIDYGAGGRHALNTLLFDVVRLSYYPTDDLRLSIGQSYLFEQNGASLGGQYGIGLGGGVMAALFVSGSAYDNGDRDIVAGLRIYFGPHDKPLIRRQREDDPEILPPEINSARLFTAAGSGPMLAAATGWSSIASELGTSRTWP